MVSFQRIAIRKLLKYQFIPQIILIQWIMPQDVLPLPPTRVLFIIMTVHGVTKVLSTFGCQGYGTVHGFIIYSNPLKFNFHRVYNGRFALSSAILWPFLSVGSNSRVIIPSIIQVRVLTKKRIFIVGVDFHRYCGHLARIAPHQCKVFRRHGLLC